MGWVREMGAHEEDERRREEEGGRGGTVKGRKRGRKSVEMEAANDTTRARLDLPCYFLVFAASFQKINKIDLQSPLYMVYTPEYVTTLASPPTPPPRRYLPTHARHHKLHTACYAFSKCGSST